MKSPIFPVPGCQNRRSLVIKPDGTPRQIQLAHDPITGEDVHYQSMEPGDTFVERLVFDDYPFPVLRARRFTGHPKERPFEIPQLYAEDMTSFLNDCASAVTAFIYARSNAILSLGEKHVA